MNPVVFVHGHVSLMSQQEKENFSRNRRECESKSVQYGHDTGTKGWNGNG